ncbi:MAG: hypothetical protein ACRDYA_17685 [Egibacteraceae bacterium]
MAGIACVSFLVTDWSRDFWGLLARLVAVGRLGVLDGLLGGAEDAVSDRSRRALVTARQQVAVDTERDLDPRVAQPSGERLRRWPRNSVAYVSRSPWSISVAKAGLAVSVRSRLSTERRSRRLGAASSQQRQVLPGIAVRRHGQCAVIDVPVQRLGPAQPGPVRFRARGGVVVERFNSHRFSDSYNFVSLHDTVW